MTHPLRRLGRSAMLALADALAAGRVHPPFPVTALRVYVPEEHAGPVAACLQQMAAIGMSGAHVAAALRLLAEERAAGQRMEDRVQLVWSPPSMDHVDARDTVVVVQDLFRQATQTVLVATYAIDEGEKSEALFGELAARMAALPELQVRVYVNVHRVHLDETPASTLVQRFAERLQARVWPAGRLPEVFYDPRSVEVEGSKRAVLHAKCVVVDGRWTMLTSANFTEAAQERNIEAGVLLDDRRFADRVRRQFEALVERGELVRLRMARGTRREASGS